MIYSFWFKISVLAILCITSAGLFKLYFDKVTLNTSRIFAALAGILSLTVAIRLIYLQEIPDVDTSTWLSAVIAFDYYPSKLWVLLNYTDSRPLTVLPLIMAQWIGLPVGYASSAVVGLLLWLGSTGLLYYACSLFCSRILSVIIAWSLSLFVATMWYGFAVYNSEHVSVFMITVAMTGYLGYVYRKWNNSWIALLLGTLMGAIIYAKFQNVPMGLVTGIFLFGQMVERKDWKQAVFLIAGSVLPTLLINMYYGWAGKLEVFWNNYFWNNFYYSYTVQFSSVPVADRFSIARIYHFILYAGNTGYYLITLGIIVAIGLLINAKKLISSASNERHVLIYTTVLFLSSVYAVLQSGNDFQHYKLYMIIPYLFLAAILIFISPMTLQRYMVMILIIGSLFQTARNLKDLLPVTDNTFTSLDNRVISSINSLSPASAPIVVWGWRDHLYVKSDRPMGYRDAHMFHFSLKSPLIPFWTTDFIEDMEINKPEIFVDAVIPSYSERGHLLLSHDRVPVVSGYIKKHYRLLEEFDGVKVFKRR